MGAILNTKSGITEKIHVPNPLKRAWIMGEATKKAKIFPRKVNRGFSLILKMQ